MTEGDNRSTDEGADDQNNNAGGTELQAQPGDEVPENERAAVEAQAEVPPLPLVGETVFYWPRHAQETDQQWHPAIVTRVRDTGVDLTIFTPGSMSFAVDVPPEPVGADPNTVDHWFTGWAAHERPAAQGDAEGEENTSQN